MSPFSSVVRIVAISDKWFLFPKRVSALIVTAWSAFPKQGCGNERVWAGGNAKKPAFPLPAAGRPLPNRRDQIEYRRWSLSEDRKGCRWYLVAPFRQERPCVGAGRKEAEWGAYSDCLDGR
jgi:hypothetical protein